MLARTLILVKAARALGLPVTASEQYPKGLGPTVAPLRAELGNRPVFAKLAFSCAPRPALADRLASRGRPQIVVAGIEAHVCVLQSALDFAAGGYDVFAVADAMGSRASQSEALAHGRLRGAAVAVVNTEMVLFEARGAPAPASSRRFPR